MCGGGGGSIAPPPLYQQSARKSVYYARSVLISDLMPLPLFNLSQNYNEEVGNGLLPVILMKVSALLLVRNINYNQVTKLTSREILKGFSQLLALLKDVVQFIKITPLWFTPPVPFRMLY